MKSYVLFLTSTRDAKDSHGYGKLLGVSASREGALRGFSRIILRRTKYWKSYFEEDNRPSSRQLLEHYNRCGELIAREQLEDALKYWNVHLAPIECNVFYHIVEQDVLP